MQVTLDVLDHFEARAFVVGAEFDAGRVVGDVLVFDVVPLVGLRGLESFWFVSADVDAE